MERMIVVVFSNVCTEPMSEKEYREFQERCKQVNPRTRKPHNVPASHRGDWPTVIGDR